PRGPQTPQRGDQMKSAIDRLARRAEDEGLLDVAYTVADSPFGSLLLASTDKGLIPLGLPNQDPRALPEEVALKVSPRGLEGPRASRPGRGGARSLLRGRAAGVRPAPRLAAEPRLPPPGAAGGQPDPYGQTRTYTQVARSAGNERAVRAAGTACGTNPIPI